MPTIDEGIRCGSIVSASAGRIWIKGDVARLPSGSVKATYKAATMPLLAIDLLVSFN